MLINAHMHEIIYITTTLKELCQQWTPKALNIILKLILINEGFTESKFGANGNWVAKTSELAWTSFKLGANEVKMKYFYGLDDIATEHVKSQNYKIKFYF